MTIIFRHLLEISREENKERRKENAHASTHDNVVYHACDYSMRTHALRHYLRFMRND